MPKMKKIDAIAAFLRAFPEQNVGLTGHSDEVTGSPDANRKLAFQRARAVRDALVRRGIDSRRLTVEGIPEAPADLKPDDPLELARCVRFEAISPGEGLAETPSDRVPVAAPANAHETDR